MPPKGKGEWAYTRRVTSNGEEVYPTVCATHYKGVQQQMDVGGGYVLDYMRRKRKEYSRGPLTTDRQ